MPVNPERLELLCRELETTTLSQGFGLLRDNKDGRCCLGVACDVYHRETGLGRWVQHDDSDNPHRSWSFIISDGDDESSSVLPTAVQKWFGFIEVNGGLNDQHVLMDDLSYNSFATGKPGQYTSLAELNDSHRFTFREIASLIRTHKDKL